MAGEVWVSRGDSLRSVVYRVIRGQARGVGAARLASQLAARGGCRPAILTRGYGGDEPSVLRRLAPGVPVLVGASRVATGRRAIRDGADLLILDDGFQHRRVPPARDIVVLTAAPRSATGICSPGGRCANRRTTSVGLMC